MAEAAKPQKEYKRPGFFRRWLTRFFVFVGVMTTFSIVMTAISIAELEGEINAPMPDKILLTYDFTENLVEDEAKPSLSQPLLKPPARFRDILVALQEAGKDARVKGFVAHLEGTRFNIAQVQELRDAVIAFRKTGRFAYIYGDSFGGFSPGMADYYLACAFDQIWLQPVGLVGISGVAAEIPFFRGVLDKVGILPQFSHKGIYKSASESLTETAPSQPNREATEALVNDLFDQLAKGIAADRRIPEADLLKMVNNGPYNDREALSLKLVDRVDSYEALLDEAKKKSTITTEKPVDLLDYAPPSKAKGDDAMPSFLKKYAKETPVPGVKPKRKIALIYGVGEIVPYKASHGTFDRGMAAEKVVEAFREAQKDKSVAAIVFRIDSPGGSPQASETVRRAMMDTRKTGIPIVMSMAGAAASGGYWIATGADKIVAEPATITGSIGVFGGKMVIAPLWEKLGVNWVGIQKGDRARMWSANTPFSEAEYAKFDALLGDTYESFLQRVMEGRKMTHDQASAIAEGRVWTGREAKARGLVDELGGLDAAIELAKKQAKIDAKEETSVQEFPEPQSVVEKFITMMTEGSLFVPDISAADVLRELESSSLASPRGMLIGPVLRVH
ncbi:MAG: signal peptide peptidase SppA [Alphaproteobacteria bacterium]|nr:MAG: signal peptide peptidase SppA [Alphaproteobacteria bacterium]